VAEIRFGGRRCRRREGFEGPGAQREILFRDRRKRGEPQDRQRPANGRGVEEEKTVEVVENHTGGTRMGIGVPISKEAPSAAPSA